MPDLGSKERELENVPISSRGMLSPIPKANNKTNPINLLPSVVTMVNNNIRPGERQGDATVPLAAPNKKAERRVPFAVVELPESMCITFDCTVLTQYWRCKSCGSSRNVASGYSGICTIGWR